MIDGTITEVAIIQSPTLGYEDTGLSDGIYYYAIVATNETGSSLISLYVEIEVDLIPPELEGGDQIPGYDLFLLFGIIIIVSIFLIKKPLRRSSKIYS